MTQTIVLAGILSSMKVNQGSIPTRKRAGFFFQSFLCALLITSMALPPSSAYALRPAQAGNNSGMEENLANALGRTSGLEESWNEDAWNHLYSLAERNEQTQRLMGELLDVWSDSEASRLIPDLWGKMNTAIGRADPDLRGAVNAFARREVALVPLPQNISLLYNRERNEAIFVIGDDARRSQLLAAFLNQPGGNSPWDMLSTLHGVVAFTSEGRLLAGLDPLAEKQVDLIHFDPPEQGKGKELLFRINEARFVPVARAIWVVPSDGDQTISGERIRKELGLPNEMVADIADPLVHLVEQLPRRVFQVPLNTQTPWYQREITTPLTNADFFQAGQEEAVSLQNWVERAKDIGT